MVSAGTRLRVDGSAWIHSRAIGLIVSERVRSIRPIYAESDWWCVAAD